MVAAAVRRFRNCATRLVAAAAFLLGSVTPAFADIRAVYRNAAGAALTIEVAANGDARADFDEQPFYILIRNHVAYVVYRPPAPVYAASIENLQTVIGERRSRITVPHTSSFGLTERGTSTIAGHVGRALYPSDMPANVPGHPFLIISEEPELAVLSGPLVAQLAFSIATVQAAGRDIPPAVVTLQQQIQRGGPLLFLGYALESLTHDAIAPDRLAFRSTPLTVDQLRQRMPPADRH